MSMDTNITRRPVNTYDEALEAAAVALSDCGYYLEDDPADVDAAAEWEVAKAMMAEYALHGDEGSLCEFLTEPGSMMRLFREIMRGEDFDISAECRRLCRIYGARFIPEAFDLLDSRSEVERSLKIDHDIKERKEMMG